MKVNLVNGMACCESFHAGYFIRWVHKMKRILLTLLAITLVTGCRPKEKEDWTAPLHEALQGATRFRVRSGGTCHRQPDQEKTLLDLRDQKQIAEVVQGIQINPNDSGFHCMCCGNPTLEFYRDETLIASLGFHHGRSLRWPDGKWAGDGLLAKDSADFLIKWLADHGVPGPKEEREESVRLQKKSEASRERWLNAMPESLKPFWSDMGDPFGSDNSQKMNTALTKQFPDKNARILALLNWYGSGEGPWSGFPSYESVAEELLLLHKTEEILGAIQNAELAEQQTEGLARLLGGWDFSRQRPDDLLLVSPALKSRLLKHSLKSDDEDKQGRARRAFGDKKEDDPTKPSTATE